MFGTWLLDGEPLDVPWLLGITPYQAHVLAVGDPLWPRETPPMVVVLEVDRHAIAVQRKLLEDERDAWQERIQAEFERDLAELEAAGAMGDVRRRRRELAEREQREVRDHFQGRLDQHTSLTYDLCPLTLLAGPEQDQLAVCQVVTAFDAVWALLSEIDLSQRLEETLRKLQSKGWTEKRYARASQLQMLRERCPDGTHLNGYLSYEYDRQAFGS